VDRITGAPVLACLFYVVIAGWITSVEKLAKIIEADEKAHHHQKGSHHSH
jgi:hypothetical protein